MIGNAADMGVRPRDCPKCGECFAEKLWTPDHEVCFGYMFAALATRHGPWRNADGCGDGVAFRSRCAEARRANEKGLRALLLDAHIR